jgi:uncharacterized protein YcbX
MLANPPLVSRLTVYPVKSFAGVELDSMQVGVAGARGDRRWMLVDAAGNTVTARKHPRMLSARATPEGDAVRLSAPGLADLLVHVPSGPPDVPVGISRLDTATAAGDDADVWCSELLGRSVRLVHLDDPARRGMAEKHGGSLADPLALVDTGPVHVTTTASLRRLDEWAAELRVERVERALATGRPEPEPWSPLDMRRFRPSVVVDGDVEPFAEDGWGRLVVGEVELRFADRCGRCVMTTIDPETQVVGREPLASLARHRRSDGEVWFGIQMVPVRTGRITVGDRVRATDR